MNTKEDISKLLGTYTTANYQVSQDLKNRNIFQNIDSSASVSLQERQLLKPEEIARIERPYALLISSNYPAMTKLPDLSEWKFNLMYGMGNKEENQLLIAKRKAEREVINDVNEKPQVNAIWVAYQKRILENMRKN